MREYLATRYFPSFPRKLLCRLISPRAISISLTRATKWEPQPPIMEAMVLSDTCESAFRRSSIRFLFAARFKPGRSMLARRESRCSFAEVGSG